MKKDNKGYTFNLTIILMLIVTIICVSVLAIVMANWNMKRTESKISSNTYTAESAIDDIRAGIQKQCSSEMKVVYTTLTSSMNTIPYNKLDDEFAKEYHARLTEKFGTDLKKTLNSYITAGVGYELTTEPTFEIKSDRKAFLRNIGVSYKTSDGEYTTKLYTDIEIDTPKMFEGMKNQVVDSTAYTDFVIISDGDLSLGSYTSTVSNDYAFPVNVLGSVYSGGNITLTMAHVKADKFLARGDLCAYFKQYGSTIEAETPGKVTQLYANNIKSAIHRDPYIKNNVFFPDKTKYSLQINADFYISHDFLANGDYQSVKLSGNYYGFENDSSIAVNSSHYNLDLTGLDTLWLAGVNHLDYIQNLYYGEDEHFVGSPVFEGNTSDLMGDSLSYNGLQVAYLVPSVCIYDKNGNQLSNPITKEQYDAGITVDLDKNKQSGGIDLGYYAKGYKPVFISYAYSGTKEPYKDKQRCYLYLTFQSTSKASKYLNLFCKTNKLFLRDEVNYFGLGNIKISDNTTLRTKGNVITYENGAVTILNNTTEQLSTYLDTGADYYRLKRNSILSTLEENSSSELLDSVFSYIVDVHKLKTDIVSFKSPDHGKVYETIAGRWKSGENGKQNGKGILYYNIDKATGYTVIIADCETLIIKKNINGLIINTGKVIFTDGATEFTGLVLCGGNSRVYSYDPYNSVIACQPMTFRSNNNGVYPVQYLLYEAPDHEKIQQYFRVLQGGSTDIVPNIHVEDYIKVRNRVTR